MASMAEGGKTILGRPKSIFQIIPSAEGSEGLPYDSMRDVVVWMPRVMSGIASELMNISIDGIYQAAKSCGGCDRLSSAFIDLAKESGNAGSYPDLVAAWKKCGHSDDAINAVLMLIGRASIEFWSECWCQVKRHGASDGKASVKLDEVAKQILLRSQPSRVGRIWRRVTVPLRNLVVWVANRRRQSHGS